jgi:hypothetical protein
MKSIQFGERRVTVTLTPRSEIMTEMIDQLNIIYKYMHFFMPTKRTKLKETLEMYLQNMTKN